MKKVGIIMGSDSDLPVIKKAVDVLREFDIPFEVHVYSAHRTPEEARDFSINARKNGFGVIIAAAGMAAHLAGAISANTTLPVILKILCAIAVRFAFLDCPIDAKSAVIVVPILSPRRIGIAPANPITLVTPSGPG